MDIDLDQIKLLLEMVGQTDVSELTVESEDERITIKKGGPVTTSLVQSFHPPHATEVGPAPAGKNVQAHNASPQASSAAVDTVSANDANLTAITSPMVGTFYRSPSPTASTFVEVGDKVSVGQTICIIEAMKLMNDLPSEIAGKIVKICAENGATVEYGQQLFLVDTKG